MTMVKITNWRGSQVVELSLALTPSGDANGSIEQAQADASAACDALGRLLAHLVDGKHLSLEDARAIAGEYADCALVNDLPNEKGRE